MAVLDVPRTDSHTVSGTPNDTFTFTFKVLSTADLLVAVIDGNGAKTFPEFSATLAGNGGTVVLASPVSNVTVRIVSNQEYDSSAEYTSGIPMPAEQVQYNIDHAHIAVQQLRDAVARCWQFSADDISSNILTASAAARAGKALGFDASGDLISFDRTAADPTSISDGTFPLSKLTNMAQDYFLARSSSGTGPVQAVSKATVLTRLGLDSVNNTTDLAKPVSTATQAAMDALDAAWDALWAGLHAVATSGDYDDLTNKPTVPPSVTQTTKTFSSTVDLPFAAGAVKYYSISGISGDITLTDSGKVANSYSVTKLDTSGGVARAITFPTGWTWLTAAPSQVLQNKWHFLSLTCYGPLETDVYATWIVSP